MEYKDDRRRVAILMPEKYLESLDKEANMIGVTRTAVILRIFAKYFGFFNDETARASGD